MITGQRPVRKKAKLLDRRRDHLLAPLVGRAAGPGVACALRCHGGILLIDLSDVKDGQPNARRSPRLAPGPALPHWPRRSAGARVPRPRPRAPRAPRRSPPAPAPAARSRGGRCARAPVGVQQQRHRLVQRRRQDARRARSRAGPGGPASRRSGPRRRRRPRGSSSSCSPNRLAWPQPKQRSWWTIRRSATQAAQHEVQDAAVAVVVPLVGRVDPDAGVERRRRCRS